MKRIKSPGSAQRFLSIAVYNVFNSQRHLTPRRTLRMFRDQAMLTWGDSRSVNYCGHGHLAREFPINVTVPARGRTGQGIGQVPVRGGWYVQRNA
jgi:hypothetical protein